MCSEMVSNSCSTGGTRSGTLVIIRMTWNINGFFSFSVDHCVDCPPSTYDLWLPLWNRHKGTDNDIRNTTQKSKDCATRTLLITGGELRCFTMVSSSCSTSYTRRVSFGTNPVLSHVAIIFWYELYIISFAIWNINVLFVLSFIFWST